VDTRSRLATVVAASGLDSVEVSERLDLPERQLRPLESSVTVPPMPSDPRDTPPDELDLGVAGASAYREQERRRANRERRTRERHPLVGGALLAVREAPAHERVWGTGGGGEEATALYLAKRCPDAVMLHDRRIPGTRANIDHIAVVPSGVYVIDSKHYKNRKIRVATPLIGAQQLLIDGRDRTKLVDSLLRHVQVVSEVLADADPAVPVRGAFCFIGADVPLLTSPTIRRVPVLNRRRLARRLRRAGQLDHDSMRAIAAQLAHRLPAR
jgi:hypothetical protein